MPTTTGSVRDSKRLKPGRPPAEPDDDAADRPGRFGLARGDLWAGLAPRERTRLLVYLWERRDPRLFDTPRG